MNIVNGKIMSRDDSTAELDVLYDYIVDTLNGNKLDIELVINACDKLSNSLVKEDYLHLIKQYDIEDYKIDNYYETVKFMLSREYLTEKIKRELGNKVLYEMEDISPIRYDTVSESLYPLGVLLHIVAGNTDGLPVFSVIEGLLTGNINILKMPTSNDNDLSELILLKLMEIEPALRQYIYVFDFPSEETKLIEKMADVSDGIVIWGGNEVVKAVRQMAKPNTKIIEWGHKISFVYIDLEHVVDSDLELIATEICQTNQLFCNSPQGICIDTEDYEKVLDFAEKFAVILDRVSKDYPSNYNINLEAQISIGVQTEIIQSINSDSKVFKGMNSNVFAYSDSNLMNSKMFRNPWIKPLKRDRLLYELKKYKNYLQTVGLICSEKDRLFLSKLLFDSGATRVCEPRKMSNSYSGMAHDGEYPLIQYTKTVTLE
ncbi:MAG: hypothetical protein GXZ08_02705 [Tissierellia bacterium]|nr:hypothetical protein [Tissierellia bacterium]